MSTSIDYFDYIKIGIASSDRILKWSFGEVTKPETINYRTLKPERDGLFCEKIFGPSKDWECYCGKYKRVRHKGIVCERCGVEVTDSKVRRHRMGHINLAAPVSHIWFLKGIPSYLGLLLDVTLRDLEQVIYFNSYIVLEQGESNYKKGQLLSEEEYEDYVMENEESKLEVGIGAEAIKKLLSEIDLTQMIESLRNELAHAGSSVQKKAKIIKRLRLVESLVTSNTDPTSMIMDVLPVTPPDLRPMVQLDGGRFATSDLNDLYRRVINRNNRLMRLIEMGAPEIIVRNEKRMLQEAVDALIDNGRRGRTVIGPNNRPLKSLSNIIEGKQGRFRQNLLGKRVDYSGRSVIVVGPQLKLHQCGLPKEMAVELFKPFVVNKLIERGIVQNIKSAKKKIERSENVVWDVLEEVIEGHPLLLNRAPTLHRLGIQAFEPVLVEGRAIQLHPLVCSAFNADFDGDQMAVHVPLSIEAQTEARMLMLAPNNILLPATGKPVITPTQDMVLGIYYLTLDVQSDKDNEKSFLNFDDVITAFEARIIKLHTKVLVKEANGEKIVTTPGRIIFNQVVREAINDPKKSVDYINKVMDKKALNRLLSQVYSEYGTSKTASLADRLKNLGFKYATKAGTTISIDDLDVPEVKKALLKNAEDEIDKSMHRYLKGEITEVERYTKVIDTWSETTEKLTQSVVDNFSRTNPVYMMAFSGARGNISQVSQLVGMRGLMADAQGQIIDLPIKSNFTEGLSVTEYIISSYGARKGLVDTALKTADSGYLTRRLVDVGQDVIISQNDCGTERGIEIEAILDSDKEIVSLGERLIGRTIVEDVKDKDGKMVIPKFTTLSNPEVAIINELGIKKIKIRSPLTCATEHGICQSCYGWSLTNNKPVDVGEAIGIIAAQSIGEPGTQLTMRTFHTGGVFRGSGSMRQVKAKSGGKVVTELATRELRTRHGDNVKVSSRENKLEIEDSTGKKQSYNIPYGATLFVNKGDEVKKGDVIAEFEPVSRDSSGRLTEKATKDITSDIGGKIMFEGFSVDEKRDRQGNISRTANKGGRMWVLSGDVYGLPGSSTILVDNEQEVKAGDVLAETITVSEHGGEVRIPDDLIMEEITSKGKKIKKIVGGKEITIVIASLTPKNAVFETTKKEQLWKVEGEDEIHIVKSPVDTIVENGMVISELIEEENRVPSSGEIRYDGVEVDENQVITKPGKIIFIPEEIHQISKDSTLKMVESGTFVTAGTEVVKDVVTHIDGIVEIKEYNDIIQEVIIRPGEVIKVNDINTLKVEDGEIVQEGTEVAPGVFAPQKSIVNIITPGIELEKDLVIGEDEIDIELDQELEIKSAEVLIRPIQEYEIHPRDVKIKFESTETDLIKLVPVTQIQYRDGARIRHLEGANLTRTSLVLQMEGYLSHLKGLVELYPKDGEPEDQNLKVVVLENLIVRRETEAASREKASLQTELLVKSGQVIEPKTPISKTQVLTRNDAKVSLKKSEDKEVRRLLLVSPESKQTVTLKTAPIIKEGDFISVDQVISASGEKTKISGKITKIKKNDVEVHLARPYLLSVGTQLQVENEGLVQRGDLLATLVFERQKTGDIVQGLPRVEELLEARKPKESAILAEDSGEAEIEYDEEVAKLLLVTESGRTEIKIPLDSNIMVSDKQKITKGQALTSGPLNPHDIIRLSGIDTVQKYLVDEVQRVYRSQGVEIADKHVEVVVRQMTKKVKIEDSGDTKLLPGELTESKLVDIENDKAKEIGGAPATHYPVLLGITKASLNTESFISAASFQETTRVLTEAAVEGKKDQLRGLKENVIIGRLIPAGTGYYHLTNTTEDREEEERKRRLSKSGARKPSAILEEIEGMFGSPEFATESDFKETFEEEEPPIVEENEE